jgi:hypothetical protein
MSRKYGRTVAHSEVISCGTERCFVTEETSTSDNKRYTVLRALFCVGKTFWGKSLRKQRWRWEDVIKSTLNKWIVRTKRVLNWLRI